MLNLDYLSLIHPVRKPFSKTTNLTINRSTAFQNRKYFSRQNTQNTTQMFGVGEMGHGDEVLRYYKNYYKLYFGSHGDNL